MEFKNKPLSRRDLLRRTAAASGLTMPVWPLAACVGSEAPIVSTPITGESNAEEISNLNLNISSVAWDRVTSTRPSWQILPDASDERNLLCPAWATKVCMGKIGTSFKVAINRPLFGLMMDESGLRNPSLPTKIVFMEEWPSPDAFQKEKVVGGLTAITEGGSSILIVMWMKFVAWRALKLAEYHKQSVEEYFNGWASIQTSEWFVHELAHAGKEITSLWDLPKKQYKIDPEIVHPQIFDFQNKYKDLYTQEVAKGRGANALIVGVESVRNLNLLRTKLYAEAEVRGIKFE